jgi:DNA-binding transcriptional MerR regulator
MRVSELSRLAGVPVPTIKYYLREGLLSPGLHTSPNQARYDQSHVRRLRLIRTLIEFGGLSVAAARGVLSNLDSPDPSMFQLLGRAQLAVAERRQPASDGGREAAGREVAQLVARHGWQVGPDNPGWAALAQLVLTIRRLGEDDLLSLLDQYADMAAQVARSELEMVGARRDPESMVEAVILGTVLGDAVLMAIRRLAQQDAAAQAFGALPADTPAQN